jgi:hypothetical protein
MTDSSCVEAQHKLFQFVHREELGRVLSDLPRYPFFVEPLDPRVIEASEPQRLRAA